MSISTTLYYFWKDTANAPLTTTTTERKIPFPNFLYTTSPSQRAWPVLTPYKLGISYCWILDGVVKRQMKDAWPGYIRAEIKDNNAEIGAVTISNEPEAGSLSPAIPDKELETILFKNGTSSAITKPSDGTQGQISPLVTPNDIEGRWYTCVSKFLFYIVQHSTIGNARDELPGPGPAAGPSWRTHHFDCVAGETGRDQIEVDVYRPAESKEYQLTWDALAKALLVFGTRVAEIEGSWDSKEMVYDGMVIAAALSIKVRGGTRVGSAMI